jgi:hypothetical protein
MFMGLLLMPASLRLGKKNQHFNIVFWSIFLIGASRFFFYFVRFFLTISTNALNIWSQISIIVELGVLLIWAWWLSDEY